MSRRNRADRWVDDIIAFIGSPPPRKTARSTGARILSQARRVGKRGRYEPRAGRRACRTRRIPDDATRTPAVAVGRFTDVGAYPAYRTLTPGSPFAAPSRRRECQSVKQVVTLNPNQLVFRSTWGWGKIGAGLFFAATGLAMLLLDVPVKAEDAQSVQIVGLAMTALSAIIRPSQAERLSTATRGR